MEHVMKDTLLEKAKALVETTKDDKAYICPVTVREVVSGLVDLIEPDADLLAALRYIGPFEVVQGDCIKRTQPHSNVNLNTNEFWAVGQGGRVGHRLRTAIMAVNSAIAKHSGRREQKEKDKMVACLANRQKPPLDVFKDAGIPIIEESHDDNG